MRAVQMTPVVSHHGEGGCWHPGEQTFRFVDLLAGDLLTLGPDHDVDRTHVADVTAAWRPRRAGGVVVATERGFTLIEQDGTAPWSIEAFSDLSFRMNDGGCDPHGRFYCGSMSYDAAPGAGALWRLDPDRTVHRVLDGLTIPNGLVWSLDGATAFHVDTPTGRIDGYDFDPATGAMHGRRTVAEVHGGSPDGMTIDASGGLWVALWGGSAVHRYDPGGVLTAVVEVGARQVTSCAFGGPDLDRLYITTSRQGLPDDVDPEAGALFVVEPGVRGVAPHEFGG